MILVYIKPLALMKTIKNVHGMEITRVGSTGNVYTYNRVNLTTHYFKEIYYFFPLPKGDIVINPNIVQNPGY